MTVATPRERPILMHARSIEGILGERKRQTRRIVKPQPDVSDWRTSSVDARWTGAHAKWRYAAIPRFRGGESWGWFIEIPGMGEGPYRCPYGQPGDLLYVRESWRPHSWPEGEPVTIEFKDGARFDADHFSIVEDFDRYAEWEEQVGRTACKQLEARGIEPDEAGVYTWEGDSPLPWRPGIHLPKWCSRIWLRVTELRVERVQEITPADCHAEGVPPRNVPVIGQPWGDDLGTMDAARWDFQKLWDETNGAGAWERNDWCWVIGFERAEAPR